MQDISSLYPHPPEQFNPLNTISQLTGVRNALTQGQLLQQETQSNQMNLDAKNALIQADRQSRNPDGTRNIQMYQNALSSGPGALLSTQENTNNLQLAQPTTYNANVNGSYRPQTVQAQQIGGVLSPSDVARAKAQQLYGSMTPQQVQTLQSQAEKLHPRLDGIISELQPIASNPGASQQDVIDGAGNAVANGHMQPHEAASGLADIPEDPQQISQWANQHLQGAMTTKHLLNMVSPQADTSNLPSVSNPPVGYSEKQGASRERINQVQNEATAVPQTNAILENLENLSKSGAPTGTIVGKIYQALAEKGFAQKGITDPTAQLQEFKKYAEQAALAGGMPASDARLSAIEGANVNSEQLPQTIQSLLPFLRASNQGKLLKQKFYNQHIGEGFDPEKELQAKQLWDENYDPRLVEFSQLPASERASYYSSHPELQSLLPKYKALKKMGIIGQ